MSLALDKMSAAQKAWTLDNYKQQIKTTLETYLTAKQESAWNGQVVGFIEQLESYTNYATLHAALCTLQRNCRSTLSTLTIGYLGSNQLHTTIGTLLNDQMPSVEDFELLVVEHTIFSPPVSPVTTLETAVTECATQQPETPLPELCDREDLMNNDEYLFTIHTQFVGFRFSGLLSGLAMPAPSAEPAQRSPKTNAGVSPGS